MITLQAQGQASGGGVSAMHDSIDYLQFYDDEDYLLGVGDRFRETGNLEAADLYTLLAWKANRAKNYHWKRLRKLAKSGTFAGAVSEIASELHSTPGQKHRLQILMEKWGFAVPTATAILTILYPKEFTVYDYRVCIELGIENNLSAKGFSDSLWSGYEEFKARVISQTPEDLCLRDKDRFLWARSTRKDIEKACAD
jgi:hypothetical protein